MPENAPRQTKIRALSSSIVPNRQAGLRTAVCLLCYRLNAHNFTFAKLDGDWTRTFSRLHEIRQRDEQFPGYIYRCSAGRCCKVCRFGTRFLLLFLLRSSCTIQRILIAHGVTVGGELGSTACKVHSGIGHKNLHSSFSKSSEALVGLHKKGSAKPSNRILRARRVA